MKRIIMACIAIAGFSFASHAQTQKGNVMVGGTISNMDLDLGSSGEFKFDLTPKAAWFIKDNLALGAYVNLGLSTAKDAGTSVNYGVGALGRYYIADKNVEVLKKAKFFLEGTVGIEGNNPAHSASTNGLGLGFGPGLAYFITPNIGLEGLIKYQGLVGFGEAATNSHLTFGIGFQVYLPGKHVKQMVGVK